jgi:argininosuccinate lyase
MTLWDKGYDVNKKVMEFTTGNGYLLDLKLVKYDCIASTAHAKMLHKIGVLSEAELEKLEIGLNEIIGLAKEGKFEIKPEEEDCHTAIENFLTKEYGEVGKKIHTCRSRNDQVLTAIRLYEKHELIKVKELVMQLDNVICKQAAKQGQIKMVGYTHMQKAMPTTIGCWLESFSCALKDDLKLMEAVSDMINQSPLGSAAGFGVPVFNIDKEMTAGLMGFGKVMENPMYCQLSRGKFEAAIAHVMSQVMLDLNKMATDMMLFSMKELGYISIPKEFCTGSSIMPQKKNPDVLELVRAKYHVVVAEEMKLLGISGNLISGYNSDISLTKEPLFTAIEIAESCLEIMALVIGGIEVDEKMCEAAMTKEIYATEEAYKLAKEGMPFRDAYKKVGEKLLKDA